MPRSDDVFASHEFVPEKDYKKEERAKLVLEVEKLMLEQEKFAHSRWWQEDALVNNRLTWLLQSQVILFAAYGLFARDKSPTGEIPVQLTSLVSVLPWLGLAISIVIVMGVRAASRAQCVLQEIYAPMGIIMGVSDITTRRGRMPGYLMPLVFVIGWGWLFKGPCGVAVFLSCSLAALLVVEQWLTFISGRRGPASQVKSVK